MVNATSLHAVKKTYQFISWVRGLYGKIKYKRMNESNTCSQFFLEVIHYNLIWYYKVSCHNTVVATKEVDQSTQGRRHIFLIGSVIMVGEADHDEKEERRKRQEGRRLRSLLSSYYGVGHAEDPTATDPSNIDRY